MDESIDEDPVEAQITAERQERKDQEAACLAAIKAIHAAGPTRIIDTLDGKQPRVGSTSQVSVTVSIEKTAPSGKSIGWYRGGQKSGKPNQRMPVAQDVENAYKEREAALRRSINPAERSANRGKKSGRVRRATGLAPKILALAKKLESEVKKHLIAKIIAKDVPCSVDYVRRVLRENSKTKAVTILHKNVV